MSPVHRALQRIGLPLGSNRLNGKGSEHILGGLRAGFQALHVQNCGFQRCDLPDRCVGGLLPGLPGFPGFPKQIIFLLLVEQGEKRFPRNWDRGVEHPAQVRPGALGRRVGRGTAGGGTCLQVGALRFARGWYLVLRGW